MNSQIVVVQVGNWQFMSSHMGRYWSEYCRAEAMCVWVLGVISCTAIEKKQRNLLCWLSRGTDRSRLLDFQFESAVSGLGNK